MYDCGIPNFIQGPFINTGGPLSLRAGVSNHISRKVQEEITYLFPNLTGCTVEVCEWISFLPYFIVNVIAYPCWD